jgi:hypothetical protein
MGCIPWPLWNFSNSGGIIFLTFFRSSLLPCFPMVMVSVRYARPTLRLLVDLYEVRLIITWARSDVDRDVVTCALLYHYS